MTQRTITKDERGVLNIFATEPTMYVDDEQRVGFTEFAEKWNGRLAMLGFVLLVVIEYGSGETFVQLVRGLT